MILPAAFESRREKGDDVREYQLQYVNGIDALFHGVSLANSYYFFIK